MFGGSRLSEYAEAPLGLSYQLGKNSEVFTKGDFLTSASGLLAVVSGNTDRPMGLCDLNVTMASNNQTVAKVEVPFYSAFNDFTFEADFDNTTTSVQANVGKFYTITGATGAQQIANGSGSTTAGQVVFLKPDPRGTGDVSRGLFRFAKTFQSYTVA